MSNVDYLKFNEINPSAFLPLLNSQKIRKHLIEHELFTTDTLTAWMNSKIEVDATSGCKVRGIVCEGELVEKKEQYTELLVDGLTIYLAENKAGTNPLINGKATRNYERHWTPIHLDIHVSDLDKSVLTVTELGGVIEGEKSGDWGAAAFCADPFGNGFCLMQLY